MTLCPIKYFNASLGLKNFSSTVTESGVNIRMCISFKRKMYFNNVFMLLILYIAYDCVGVCCDDK